LKAYFASRKFKLPEIRHTFQLEDKPVDNIETTLAKLDDIERRLFSEQAQQIFTETSLLMSITFGSAFDLPPSFSLQQMKEHFTETNMDKIHASLFSNFYHDLLVYRDVSMGNKDVHAFIARSRRILKLLHRMKGMH